MPAVNLRSQARPKYPKRVVILRHGQSEQNAALDLTDPDIEKLCKICDADIQLTEYGKWQAREVRKFLAQSERFDICFCSPYDRALQTADAVLSQLPYKLRLFKENTLREKEFGRLHGLDVVNLFERRLGGVFFIQKKVFDEEQAPKER